VVTTIAVFLVAAAPPASGGGVVEIDTTFCTKGCSGRPPSPRGAIVNDDVDIDVPPDDQ
jgi:hypothetical protein